jgi:hypothetical protein
MSLAQMQSALAVIVRYPTSFAGEALSDLLSQYDLSAGEIEALRELAENRELGKFGLGIQEMRSEIVSLRLPLLKRVVPEETLLAIFSEEFEPLATEVANRDLVLEFLTFLQEDEQARSLLEGFHKPYVWDFIAFEKAQLEISRDDWYGLDSPQAGSPLATKALYLLDLFHDLPGFLSALQSQERIELEPEPATRRTFVLLVRAKNDLGYRLFELEPETFFFLKGALAGRCDLSLPSSYSDLVGAGLCREVSHA